MPTPKKDYHSQREAQERDLARKAKDDPERIAHEELAEAHAEKAKSKSR